MKSQLSVEQVQRFDCARETTWPLPHFQQSPRTSSSSSSHPPRAWVAVYTYRDTSAITGGGFPITVSEGREVRTSAPAASEVCGVPSSCWLIVRIILRKSGSRVAPTLASSTTCSVNRLMSSTKAS